jgi:hypothetical protein
MFDEIKAGGALLMIGIVAIILYYLYKFLQNPLCLNKAAAIPGVTGPTVAQQKAPQIAAANLQAGGQVIWSDPNSTDYDYMQPNGDVTQVRSSFWGQLTGTPVTYTTISRDAYQFPSYGNANPRFACCYNGTQSSLTCVPM